MIDITQEQISENWNQEYNKPLVSIQCMTYNQENYIAQTLDSLLMQKTSFPFEIVVHDDASTDKTCQIIKKYEEKYPLLIKGIYETENQYSKHDGVIHRILNKASVGKYLAFCEGDDYWIDEKKLEKQISFLENNVEYKLSYSRTKLFIQKTESYEGEFGSAFNGYVDLLINGNKIPTLSVCLSKQMYDKYLEEIQPETRNWLMGDYPVWLYFAHESKIHFLDEVTCCYRVLQESVSHSVDPKKQSAFYKSFFDIQKAFINYFDDKLEYSEIQPYTYGVCKNFRDDLFKQTDLEMFNIFEQSKKSLSIVEDDWYKDPVEVFFNTGNDFSEDQKKQYYSCPITVSYLDSLCGIRIDPSNQICCVKIRYIKIDGENINFTTNADFQIDNYYYFNTNDSHIFIEINKKFNKMEFDFEIEYTNSKLIYFVNEQKTNLLGNNQYISNLQNEIKKLNEEKYTSQLEFEKNIENLEKLTLINSQHISNLQNEIKKLNEEKYASQLEFEKNIENLEKLTLINTQLYKEKDNLFNDKLELYNEKVKLHQQIESLKIEKSYLYENNNILLSEKTNLNDRIIAMENSLSWKITKLLRCMGKIFNR